MYPLQATQFFSRTIYAFFISSMLTIDIQGEVVFTHNLVQNRLYPYVNANCWFKYNTCTPLWYNAPSATHLHILFSF